MRNDAIVGMKKRVVAGLVVFVVTVVLSVAINSLGHGFDVGRSVSRYVGFEMWSSVLFAVGNAFVVAMVASFLWNLGENWRMPRLFFYLVLLISVTLMMLSVFPIGLCDFDGHISLVSRIHEISSRVMFVTMMMVAVIIATSSYGDRGTRIASSIYVLYSFLCVVGYLMEAFWFVPCVLLLESAYVIGFLVMLLFCRTRQRD